ncbi:MAG TPA: hypothetical protein DCZ75_11445 [Geobacter sp.]|nr:hypothetical protein [Geobacter sp.]
MAQRITVTCYAGYKADERPTSFKLEERTFAVQEVIDRWYDQDSNYFEVVVEDGSQYLLRHDLNYDAWELVQQRDPEGEDENL